MSVNTVSGTSLRQDLVSALRQARAASTQPIDASGYSTASQDTGTAQSNGTTAQSPSAAASPALSSDLMASLLQLQSDFSQMGLQTGVTSGADADETSAPSGVGTSQGAAGPTPVHHHHGHHARASEANAGGDEPTTEPTDTADASADTGASSPATAASGDSDDGLQSLMQQVTKAIAAYATGGPVGVAAAALTSSAKA